MPTVNSSNRRVERDRFEQVAEVAQRVRPQRRVLGVERLGDEHPPRFGGEVPVPEQGHHLAQGRGRADHVVEPPAPQFVPLAGLALAGLAVVLHSLFFGRLWIDPLGVDPRLLHPRRLRRRGGFRGLLQERGHGVLERAGREALGLLRGCAEAGAAEQVGRGRYVPRRFAGHCWSSCWG
jgi:hypothetical protein